MPLPMVRASDAHWTCWACLSYCLLCATCPLCLCLQALCFDCEEDMIDALSKDTEQFRGKVVIIR